MKINYSFILPVIISTIITACQPTGKGNLEGADVKASIHKPFPNIELVPNRFKVSTTNDTILRLDNGTTIYIPGNIFVDASGKVVKGEVDISYEEFHDAIDILCSGIPMTWDSAGTIVDFQTAGMMEIRAYQNNEELQIAKGKAITVDMASNEKDRDYEVFYYDEEVSNWSCLRQPLVKENEEKQQELKELGPAPVFNRIPPREYDPKAYTFDIDINYHAYPELKDLHGVMWQYAGKSAKEDPRNIEGFKQKKWVGIEIEILDKTKNEYRLKLTDAQKNTFNTTATPVLRGKMLAKAQAEFDKQFESYRQMLEFKKAEQLRIEKKAELFRTFKVENLGIYNYDRQLKLEDRIELVASFDFNKKSYDEVDFIDVFLITGNNKAVVHYPKYNWKLFAYSPKSDNKLIAVLPNGKVAIYSQKMFDAINTSQFSSEKRSDFTFNMKVIDTPMSDKEKLREALEDI